MFTYTENDTKSHRNTQNIHIYLKTDQAHGNTVQLFLLFFFNSILFLFKRKKQRFMLIFMAICILLRAAQPN